MEGQDPQVLERLVSILEELEKRVGDLEKAMSSIVQETAPELAEVPS